MAPHPFPQLDADDLAALARGLLDERPPWPDPPLLVALPWGDPWRVDDLGADVEVLPIPAGVDPLQVLCHQRRRPEWVALGVVADGWAVDAAAPEVEVDWRAASRTGPPADQVGRRVRALHLAGVDGAVAIAVRCAATGALEVHASPDGGAPHGPAGALADGLRRALELPTPPCPVPAVELWAALWLEAVVERAASGPQPRWRTVAGLHPGHRLLTAERPDLPLDPVRDLVAIGRVVAKVIGWDRLHLLAATTPDAFGGWLPSSDVAAWADAGMFARLVLGGVPPVAASRRRLQGGLGPTALRGVDAALDAWCIGAGLAGSAG